MAEVPINVLPFPAANPTKLKIQPSLAPVSQNEEPTLRWIPQNGLTIEYVGFAAPVGPDEQIEVPHPDPNNGTQWIAHDRNDIPALFSYSVFAKTASGVVISSDPQIENEGKGGMEVEPPGSGKGSG